MFNINENKDLRLNFLYQRTFEENKSYVGLNLGIKYGPIYTFIKYITKVPLLLYE